MEFTVTQEDVVDIAPELGGDALTAGQWEKVLLFTKLEISLEAFGTEEVGNMAATWLAAHKAAKLKAAKVVGSGIGGAAGPLSSITVGSVSKTYRTSSSVDSGSAAGADLQSTAYGREYLRLVRIYAARIAIA